jgi:hypothetical protein
MEAFSNGFMATLGVGFGIIVVALTVVVCDWAARLGVEAWRPVTAAAARRVSHYHSRLQLARNTRAS